MRITSYGHAAVVLEHADTPTGTSAGTVGDDDHRAILAIDPGTFADAEAALADATTILLTHEHFDHVDDKAIRARLAHPGVRVWAPEPVAESLRASLDDDAARRVFAAEPGDRFEVDGFTVTVGGGWHAVIHEAIPLAANVTYLVEAGGVAVYHPGDSFDDPPVGPGLPPVDVLLVPVSGPWLRLGDAMDFAAGIDAPTVIPIHGALLSDLGWMLVNQRLDTARIAGTYTYRRLASGESLDVTPA